MEEENKYGADYVTLTDEDGVESEYEVLDMLDYEGESYMAFAPADTADADETEVVILKVVEDPESGDDMLVTVDDDELLDKLFEEFLSKIEDDEEE